MSTEEELFEASKAALQSCCCNSNTNNKIQAYSIHAAGYRVYCHSCCATADGSTMDIAINNFKNKCFKYSPQV